MNNDGLIEFAEDMKILETERNEHYYSLKYALSF